MATIGVIVKPFNPQMLMVKRPPPYKILAVLEDGGNNIPLVSWLGIFDFLSIAESFDYGVDGIKSFKIVISPSLDVSESAAVYTEKLYGDLSAYRHEWIYLWLYFPDLTYILPAGTAVRLILGSGWSDYLAWNFTLSQLAVGWNLLKGDFDNPSSTVGSADFSALSKAAVYIYEVSGNAHDIVLYLGKLAFVKPSN